ncbi:MAG: hypothetical protein HQ559_13645 [Lentisphaerae bacterium]|nr:hypothetical protein [Lentisphaerota bacterium]
MVFYVYMQPEVIGDAAGSGKYGIQYLIALLRGFLQNCCLAEFCDNRSLDRIREQVKELPEDFDRVAIKKLLGQMAKLNRFVYCLQPDYDGEKTDLDCVCDQARDCLLNLILVSEADAGRQPPVGVEVSSLSSYQYTPFEEERSLLSSDGRTRVAGELDEGVFLDEHFLRALRYSSRIEICDRLAGTYFSDNYKYTIQRFMSWLGTALADPGSCRILFHFGEAEGKKSKYIESELTNYRADGGLAGTPTEIRYYHTEMPHQRFILTDQFAIELDRGLDFLDRTTRKNRDVSVNTKNHGETTKLLTHYAGNLEAVRTL